jgi:hypothetical protein
VNWIIGLDLRAQSGGALRFADWLARATTAERRLADAVTNLGGHRS